MNGVPSCANTWLNDQTARGEWGFDGYITSDCDADADVFNAHHFTHTKEEAVAAVLKAGTDIDCTSFVPRNLASALHQGLVREADLDVRLTKLFMVRMRLGHFVDRRGPLDERAANWKGRSARSAEAEAAQFFCGCVVLKTPRTSH